MSWQALYPDIEFTVFNRSPLKIHLLPPSLNRRLDSRLRRREHVGQLELSFGHAGRIMFFDPKLRRESPILLLV